MSRTTRMTWSGRLSQGGSIRTWALDPANRLVAMTSTGLGATALTNHYGDPGTDSPAWTVDAAADATVSTRRYVGGLAGFLAEITTTVAFALLFWLPLSTSLVDRARVEGWQVCRAIVSWYCSIGSSSWIFLRIH